MVPDARPDAGNSAQQEWELHHRQGHITKWPECLTCQKEVGTRVVHRRKDPAERQTGVLHADWQTWVWATAKRARLSRTEQEFRGCRTTHG
eukprot:4467081-Amphidinium_carterae.1